jgi:RNA polymerase sigma factor (sigma-70 family)
MSNDTELLRGLEEAVASMPWIQREIFQLHRLEGYSYAEIAWLMRVSERFVERQMAKAIYKLSKQMDGHSLSWWERWF